MSKHKAARAGLALALLIVIAGCTALGIWQVKRLSWKLALIEQVEHRLAAPPVPAPGPERWPAITSDDTYLRIRLHGRFRGADEVLTQAVTDLGSGFWVMTPLDDDRGFTVLVNRGFVPSAKRDPGTHAAPAGPVALTGLLRITEPHGGFLRSNDPAAGRWYSRDVAAIADDRHLARAAPYFVDADAASSPGWPRGGLTVVRFPNNHLQYALTWFAMATLLAGTLIVLAWRGRRA